MKLIEIQVSSYKGPPEPAQGEKLASYKDDEGYTIEIVWGVPKAEELERGVNELGYPIKRCGVMYIISPKGKKVQGGYWMNWPEPEWHISSPLWQGMAYKDRAKLEVKEQATKYSLADDFKFHLDHRKYLNSQKKYRR